MDWFDCSHLSEEIDRINADERYCTVFFVGGAFETPWYMRGMLRFLMDLVECPDIAEAISRRATEFYKQRALRAIEESNGRIALVYRLASREHRDFLAVSLSVFFGGTAAALAIGAMISDLGWDAKAVGWGAAAGLASVTANIAFLLAVRAGRLAASWTIFSMALVVPVVMATLVWHEDWTLDLFVM